MRGQPTGFWGKLRSEGDALEWHPLDDHCADVAACAEALLQDTALGKRLAALAGVGAWSDQQIARFGVYAALHDIGKFNLGFQRRWRRPGAPGAGHVGPVLAFFVGAGADLQDRFGLALDMQLMEPWVAGDGAARLLLASVCHHGKPCDPNAETSFDRPAWSPGDGLDPMHGIRHLLADCRRWFPAAFAVGGVPVPDTPALQHAFSGLVTLADWLGSDARRFRFREPGDFDRMEFSRAMAHESLRDLGLAPAAIRARLPAGAPTFSAVAPDLVPRPAQSTLAALPLSDEAMITILEAETGTGKTEAALLHFLRLFHAGAADGMYFALPTRTAATEIHGRVERAVRTMFPVESVRPPVVLAVPGYLRVDDREGSREGAQLARFEVLWNDDDSERWRFRGWAAESSKRYLAGAISVGTIDQALLSVLAVPHAHMRAVSLMRQLLVVDEVHASDTYMTQLLRAVLRRHLDAGGRALLLSATLGSAARGALLSCACPGHPTASLAAALAAPYPSLTVAGHARGVATWDVPGDERRRRTALELAPIAQDPSAVAALALSAVQAGARVLVLRNTVRDALATQRALEVAASASNAEAKLFRCAGRAAPYHARFAREDRVALDKALLAALGRTRDANGVVVVATQTAQQSLDIDVDLLVTDLCPADVLLQRIGRLHRHQDDARPHAFLAARAHVLVPANRDLGRFLGSRGDARGPCGLGTVYEDLRMLEATWRLIESQHGVAVPSDCREWVERTTHPEALSAIVRELGGRWIEHYGAVTGKHSAQRNLALLQLARWDAPFGTQETLFPGKELDRRVATRLGASDRRAHFDEPVRGAFVPEVSELSVPGWWAKDLPDDAVPTELSEVGGEVHFRLGVPAFRYSRFGLERVESGREAGDAGASDGIDA